MTVGIGIDPLYLKFIHLCEARPCEYTGIRWDRCGPVVQCVQYISYCLQSSSEQSCRAFIFYLPPHPKQAELALYASIVVYTKRLRTYEPVVWPSQAQIPHNLISISETLLSPHDCSASCRVAQRNFSCSSSRKKTMTLTWNRPWRQISLSQRLSNHPLVQTLRLPSLPLRILATPRSSTMP